MKERLTQLGLVGFGREVESQSAVLAEVSPQAQEVESKLFIVPQNTTIFRSLNSDLGLTSVGPFYVTKIEGSKVVRGMIKVKLSQSGVEVYRDGQRVALREGEIIEVPIKRLVKKQRDRFDPVPV